MDGMRVLAEMVKYTKLYGPLCSMSAGEAAKVNEVRVRVGRPTLVHMGKRVGWLGEKGFVEGLPLRGQGVALDEAECRKLLDALCEQSLYAREEELRQGYLSLAGGCRAGICGQMTVMANGALSLRNATGFNLRVARAVEGCANAVMPYIRVGEGRRPHSTLVISAPGDGKTTLLRDTARQLAETMRVTVVDERGEIAGCYRGVPTLNVGLMADVLDGCPKADGIFMAIRAMRPDAVIADEIGRAADILALEDASASGVAVIASAHAATVEEARARPMLREAMQAGRFERIIVLGSPPGTIKGVYDAQGRSISQRGERAC